ncbi:MAG: tRNA dihydrouridine synthase DusB [Prevotellaceae bacterium]|jgi:nifR3 family TIM-barrel protein|nr:tRNA dihydrouridine synthase DusB [Prevotellaceae bacterium]
MRISNINFPEKPLFLAPMEDVTDPAFRLLCKNFGADMVTTEFVSADALVRSVNRTMQKLTVADEERPVAIQIYGKDVPTMTHAAQIVEQARPDVIDLNFGCPVKKVAVKGAGAGLLRDVAKMLEITQAVVRAVKIPVTAKTRLGWDDNSKIIVDLAERLQDCGIQALAIHGRTRAQMYKEQADWELISKVKNNPRMRIPIIGNGDVATAQRAAECFERYGVDAVMIGRATTGQPWLFAEIKNYFKSGHATTDLSFEDKKEILKKQIVASVRWLDFDEQIPLQTIENQRLKGIIHCRRHLAATPVFKGIPNFRNTRIEMLRAETLAELFNIIDNIKNPV